MAGLSEKEFKRLDSIYWHDGILDDICFSMGKNKGDIELKIRAYDNSQSPSRKRLKINFSGVLSCHISCDIGELLENLFAGNISNGYFKPSVSGKKLKSLTLHLYLCDGYFQITSKNVKMTKVRDN
jgi:hypothetical protein